MEKVPSGMEPSGSNLIEFGRLICQGFVPDIILLLSCSLKSGITELG